MISPWGIWVKLVPLTKKRSSLDLPGHQCRPCDMQM